MTRQEIVEQVAQERRVEQIIENICRPCADRTALEDLAQMVYEILLTYDAEKVLDLWSKGQLNYFLVRIIYNQFRSRNSPFYHLIREFGQRSVSLTAPVREIWGEDDA